MNKVISKLIISIAIGIIVSQLAGNFTKETKYYKYGKSKIEVTKEIYIYENKRSSSYNEEEHFNKRNALTYGLISFSVIAIILFIPILFKKSEK